MAQKTFHEIQFGTTIPINSSLKTESCEWLSTEEAATHLRISEHTLRNLVSMGKMPYYKFGRRLRFLKTELNEHLLRNRRGGF